MRVFGRRQGEVGHINSRWQQEHGVPAVGVDEFVNDWQNRTNNRSNYRLIRKYAENCGECFDWFIEPLSPEEKARIYPRLKEPSPHMPRTLNGFHAYPGTAMMGVEVQNSAIKKNQELAEKNGAVFLFGTKAKELIMDGKRISGAVAETGEGEVIRILAAKGVILAAGDYSRNRQMCEKPGTFRILYAADTLEELASYMYEDEEIKKTFLYTVKCYNEMCRAGRDTEFGKEPALLHEIRKAPFYAVGQPKDSHHPIGQSFKLLVTVSGLLINEDQKVLDDDYEPIRGLFATGNCSGCRFGFQYTTSMPGQSISIAQTLGRVYCLRENAVIRGCYLQNIIICERWFYHGNERLSQDSEGRDPFHSDRHGG